MAIGPGTAAALEEHGLAASLVPDEHVAEGVVAALAARARRLAGRRVLLPRARGARPVLPDELRRQGAQVDVVELYEASRPRRCLSGRRRRGGRLRDLHVGLDRRAASSKLLGAADLASVCRRRLAALGPVTSATLREWGCRSPSRRRLLGGRPGGRRLRGTPGGGLRGPSPGDPRASTLGAVTRTAAHLLSFGLRLRRRLRRHVRGIIAASRPTCASSTSPTASPGTTSSAPPSCCATRCATCQRAPFTWRWSIRASAAAPRRGAALRRRPLLRGPRQRHARARCRGRRRHRRRLGDHQRGALHDPAVGDLPGRDIFAPVAARLAGACAALSARRSSRPASCASRSRRRGPRGAACGPPPCSSTASATSPSTWTPRSRGGRPGRDDRVVCAGERYLARLARSFIEVRPAISWCWSTATARWRSP